MDYASKNWVLSLLNRNKRISLASWSNMLLDTTGPFEIKAWNKDLIAMLSSPIDTGTASGTAAYKLVDATTDFSTIPVGSVVRNGSTGYTARVLAHSGATSLWLSNDIFASVADYSIYAAPELPEQFIELTGALLDGDGVKVADTDTKNHLIDGDSTTWTGLVSVNDWVWNLNTGRASQITAVAAHDLTLLWDCFPNGNEPYLIYKDTIQIADAESPLNGKSVFEMNVSGRYLGGRLASDVELDSIMDHGHNFHIRKEYNTTAGSNIVYRAGTKNITDAEAVCEAIPGQSGRVPYVSDHTQPRTVGQVYIMRIK